MKNSQSHFWIFGHVTKQKSNRDLPRKSQRNRRKIHHFSILGQLSISKLQNWRPGSTQAAQRSLPVRRNRENENFPKFIIIYRLAVVIMRKMRKFEFSRFLRTGKGRWGTWVLPGLQSDKLENESWSKIEKFRIFAHFVDFIGARSLRIWGENFTHHLQRDLQCKLLVWNENFSLIESPQWAPAARKIMKIFGPKIHNFSSCRTSLGRFD